MRNSGYKVNKTSIKNAVISAQKRRGHLIKKLNFLDSKILETSLRIQREAYEVEAHLIGSRNIPPLHETIDQLKEAKEVFWGYFESEELVGFISIEDEGQDLRISRLVVDPKLFSKKIGTQLVRHVLENLRAGRDLIVSTGDLNLPAKRLYEKFGFFQKRVFTIEGISIAEFKYEKR